MPGQIAIIGLGQIGGSVGLALREAKSPLQRIGFDKDGAVLRAAESIGVVDQAARRLPDAVRDADIVLLALPLGEIKETLTLTAPYLKESAVVMDTSPVKASLTALMQKMLPEGRYYVGLVPAVTAEALVSPETGLKGARPDLFKRTVMIVDAPHGTLENVEKLATNFVRLIGAKPLLADIAESDGLMTAAHILPQLAAAALLDATVDQPGWLDARKLAGRPFVGVTGGLAYYDDVRSLKVAALGNPQAVGRALDVLIASLQGLRDGIQQGDEEAVGSVLQDAFDARERWLNERGAAEWLSEGGEPADLPNVGDQLMNALFGNRLADRMKKNKEKG
ncbi:MAG TPA: prephenate dehydrogenase/arogenate dehydrogenase family protein [Anaerolineales bacterium]|nr:prephenate dehydrogenase/arogenate dehydrogenase family protein [Anaerolineales bacterium]